jgi:O-antigen ligase
LVLAAAATTLVRNLPAAPRLTFASPDRVEALNAALQLVAQRPLIGVGPGRAALVLASADGSTRVARYVHNEYVQVLAELGAVGGVLLAALLGTAGWLLFGQRRAARELFPWAGVVASLAAFALHSALDFLWHLPALPLTAALIFGLAIPVRKEGTCTAAPGSSSSQRSSPASPSPSPLPPSRR